MANETIAEKTIVGTASVDTLTLPGSRAEYALQKTVNGFAVKDLVGTEGTASLKSIERIAFADTKVAIDIQGNAGNAAKLIGAIFGKTYVADKALVGVALQLLDSGISYADLVRLALQSSLFGQLAGSHSNEDLVYYVYENVVGMAPTKSEHNYFVGLLESNQLTQANIGLLAAETPSNAVSIGLAGLAETGIEFI